MHQNVQLARDVEVGHLRCDRSFRFAYIHICKTSITYTSVIQWSREKIMKSMCLPSVVQMSMNK